jgi:glycosyltransferase involved in cell wall biosynthesis
MLHAWLNQREVNHVTGDINFIALALKGKRTILTNHDCGYVVRTRGLRRWRLWLLWLKLPVRRVAAITTVSSQIKEEVIRYTACAPDKIRVIPNPVPLLFSHCPKPFNSGHPRILQVGTAANKNLPCLIEALAGLKCTLVIVGKIDSDVQGKLEGARTVYENYVDLSEAELRRQYEQCDLVAFASLYEGFGLPILEAQAVGRPVVTSKLQPMCDVAGDAAVLVDPMDAQSVRAGIDRIVSDAALRARLIDRGLQNVDRFHPRRVAQQYLDLYQEILST